ncbi:MAG: hypothetical protein SF052_03155 [Bacteroidia bacterium]|nr:hypothetical protein [Bacteroidia bacterium]
MNPYQEELDRLFRGEMPREERLSFFKRMETEPELAEAFRFQETMILALSNKTSRENYEKAERAEGGKSLRTKRLPRLYIYGIAASIALIGLVFIWQYLFSGSQFPDGISYELRPMSEVKGSGTEGLIAFPKSVGDYQQNLDFFVKGSDSIPITHNLTRQETLRRYYAGINYLYAPAPLKNLEKAEKYLSETAEYGEEINDRWAAWLQLSLLYYEKGDQDRAIQALQEVTKYDTNPENKYYQIALKNLKIISPKR